MAYISNGGYMPHVSYRIITSIKQSILEYIINQSQIIPVERVSAALDYLYHYWPPSDRPTPYELVVEAVHDQVTYSTHPRIEDKFNVARNIKIICYDMIIGDNPRHRAFLADMPLDLANHAEPLYNTFIDNADMIIRAADMTIRAGRPY